MRGAVLTLRGDSNSGDSLRLQGNTAALRQALEVAAQLGVDTGRDLPDGRDLGLSHWR